MGRQQDTRDRSSGHQGVGVGYNVSYRVRVTNFIRDQRMDRIGPETHIECDLLVLILLEEGKKRGIFVSIFHLTRFD